jgi:hypothetical protein
MNETWWDGHADKRSEPDTAEHEAQPHGPLGEVPREARSLRRPLSLGIGYRLSPCAITNPRAPARRPGTGGTPTELEMPFIEGPLVNALPTRLARARHQELRHLACTPPDPRGESVVQMVVLRPQPALTNVRHWVSFPATAPVGRSSGVPGEVRRSGPPGL